MDATTANPVDRDVVVVEGPEAASFLHGQVSQDVEGLGIGESRLSLLLEPRGRLEVFFRITRSGDQTYVLDTDPGVGELLRTSLERFKLRTKAEFSQPDWIMLAVRGPEAVAVAEAADGVEVAVAALWSGEHGVDLFGVAPSASVGASSAFDELRARRGLPAMGIDLLEGDIPNETGVLVESVSFDKGCYRGQELVERIDARQGGRRSLRRFHTDAVPN
ncbi:MAG: hypothetical protein P8N02_13905, partial [Actinomycetota bacterium]|nr:hypothetical protein [Actinomycetota bacterium]